MQESHIVSLLKTQQSSASFLGLKINCWTVGNARLGLFYSVIFSQIFFTVCGRTLLQSLQRSGNLGHTNLNFSYIYV